MPHKLFVKSGADESYLIGFVEGTNVTGVDVDTSDNIFLAVGGSIAKLNSTGILQWRKYLSTSTDPYQDAGFLHVKTDSAGNVYGYGNYRSYNSSSGQSRSSAYMASFDSSGNKRWEKQYLTNILDSQAVVQKINLSKDSNGNFYAYTGYNGGSTYDYLGYFSKFNSSGTISIAFSRGAFNTTQEGSIVSDASGNMYMSCFSSSTFNTFKYDSGGTLVWVRVLGSTGGGVATGNSYGTAVDGSGNVITCGQFQYFSTWTAVVAKYSSDGTLLWQRGIEAPDAIFREVATDAEGNIYLAGDYTFNSYPRAMLVKYDSSGTLLWQRAFSALQWTRPFRLSIDHKDNLWYAGIAVNSGGASSGIFAKLPKDGTKTGSYNVGGYTVSYSQNSLTNYATSYPERVLSISLSGAGTGTTDKSLDVSSPTNNISTVVL